MSMRGWIYRKLMTLAHKYNWHRTKSLGPFADGTRQNWCQWCGLREVVPKPDPWTTYTIGYNALYWGPSSIKITNIQSPCRIDEETGIERHFRELEQTGRAND